MFLSIATSNRNRIDVNSNSTKFFLKSLENQSFKDFELVIADGGSNNIEEIKYLNNQYSFDIRVVPYEIGEDFERAKLNNVAVRNSKGSYVMTTDVDMVLGRTFLANLVSNCSYNSFVESRTLYWKPITANKLYNGEISLNDIDELRVGRIKQRTSAGGCQCTSAQNWSKLRGFNEAMVGWGSEDVELLKRANMMGLNIVWMGECRDSIELFHQPHPKPNIKRDLECQDKNKRLYNRLKDLNVNKDGWGGQK